MMYNTEMITKNREVLELLFRSIMDGVAGADAADYNHTAAVERILNDCMTTLIVKNAEYRAER